MKKWRFRSIALWLLCLPLLLPSCVAKAEESGPQVSSASAAAVDIDTGEFFCDKNSTETLYTGELTKIMTVLLLAEHCDLNEKTAFSEILYRTEEGSPALGLQPGEEISLYDAACAVILGSANDVCIGIAEYVAGSPEAFAELMNRRAEELGCQNTHFSEPCGLSRDDQYTCVGDLARIFQAAYQNEKVREICWLLNYSIPATNLTGTPRDLQTCRQMYENDAGYYQEWRTWMTGSDGSESQDVVVTFGTGAKDLVAVAMGGTAPDQTFEDTIRLITYGFTHDGGTGTMTEAASENATENIPENASEHVSENTTEQAAETETVGGTERPEASVQPVQNPAAAQTEMEGGSGNAQTDGDVVVIQTGGASGENPAQDGTSGNVMSLFAKHMGEWQSFVKEYAQDHFMTVLIGGCIFLLLLFVVILLLLLRIVTNSRIRRKRRNAEKVMQEKEEQIERMTLEELEAELHKEKKTDR